MANICFNEIKVYGSTESLVEFINFGLVNMGLRVESLDDVEGVLGKAGLNENNPLIDKIVEVTDTYSVNPRGKDYKVLYYSLECYVPMPSDYYYVDCSNSFRSQHPTDSEEYKKELALYNEMCDRQKNVYGVCGWLEWRREHLGNKWNCDLVFEGYSVNADGSAEVTLKAESAWTPIIKWLKSVQDKFKSLRFRMESEEEGEQIYVIQVADGYERPISEWKTDEEIEFHNRDMM